MTLDRRHAAESAFEILDACECAYIGAGTVMGGASSRFASWLRGPLLVVSAAQKAGAALAWWAGLLLSVLIVTKGIGGYFDWGGAAQRQQVFTIAAMLITGCFIFPTPSRLAFADLTGSNINRAGKACAALESVTDWQLDAIERSLSLAQSVCNRRLGLMWILPAGGWATAVYLAQSGFSSGDGKLMGYSFAVGIVAGFAAILVASYARGTFAVFGLAAAVIETGRQAIQLRIAVGMTATGQLDMSSARVG